MSVWFCTIAGGLERPRLERIWATWPVPGIEGLCVVAGPDDDLPKPFPRTRIVRTTVPFSRSTWRNIGLRFTPAHTVVLIDADCIVAHADALTHAIGLVDEQAYAMPVFSPAYASEAESKRFFDGKAPDALDVHWEKAHQPWAGTLVTHRLRSLLMSFDDDMVGWGFEDADFCARARQLGSATPAIERALVHIHHPSRGSGKQPKRQNMAIHEARAEKASDPAHLPIWWYRAVREIAMVPLTEPELGAVDARTENGVRMSVWNHLMSVRYSAGWLALDALWQGRIPEGCIYEPLSSCTVSDA